MKFIEQHNISINFQMDRKCNRIRIQANLAQCGWVQFKRANISSEIWIYTEL